MKMLHKSVNMLFAAHNGTFLYLKSDPNILYRRHPTVVVVPKRIYPIILLMFRLKNIMVGIILICTINLNVKPFIRMTAGCGLKLLVTILLMLVFVTLQIGGPIIESLQSFIIINIFFVQKIKTCRDRFMIILRGLKILQAMQVKVPFKQL